MRWAVLLGATLVACGGQILDVPNDASPKDSASTKDASVVDVVVFDVKQQDSPPTQPPGCGVSTKGLLAYFPLDSDTKDHSGNGNDAAGKNLVPMQGVVGNAMAFDGSTSVLRVTSGAGVLSGPRTLCAWMQVKPTPGLGSPLFTAGLSTNTDFYSLSSMAPNGACPAPPMTPFIEHTGSTCLIETGPPLMQGPWQFICYAFDGSKMMFASDGFFAPPMPMALFDYPLATLFIGSNPTTSNTTGTTFTGIIDEVSVWSVFLSPTDTQALWNNGKGCPLL